MRHGTLLFALGLTAAAAVPVAGSALRPRGTRCALDGVRVSESTRAAVRHADGREEVFCGSACLARRLRDAPGATATVTDEATGRAVDAASAWFVESAVPSVPSNGSRLHAFAREADARRHAGAHHGTVLAGPGLAAVTAAKGGAR